MRKREIRFGRKIKTGLIITGLVGIIGGVVYTQHNSNQRERFFANSIFPEALRREAEIEKISKVVNGVNIKEVSDSEFRNQYMVMAEGYLQMCDSYKELKESKEMDKAIRTLVLYDLNKKAGGGISLIGGLILLLGLAESAKVYSIGYKR